MDDVAAETRDGVSGTVGDVFRVDEPPVQQSLVDSGDPPDGAGAFYARVDAFGRFRTRDVDLRGADGAELRGPRWLFRTESEVSGPKRSAYRVVIESRLFALAAGSVYGEAASASEIESAPLPVPGRSVCGQLEAVVAGGRRSERADWAAERIVAELYELKLPELVVLQQAFAGRESL
jgi:hypothetical protein